MKKVLLTGAGAPGGPGIIKALKQAGYDLYTSDCNDKASGHFLHSNFVQIPKAEEESFIPFVLEYCVENKIEVLFPLVTKELFKFSEAKHFFASHGIKVIVSDIDSLRIANDKGKLYEHLACKNIAVPKFQIINDVPSLIKAAEILGYPNVPVVIKPTFSNGSRGVRILQENADDFSLLFDHKPTHLYSKLSTISTTLEQHNFPQLLVSEYLPGPEITIDTIVQQGKPKLILPRTREKINGGISVQGTFVNNKQVIDYCRQIIRSLNLSGPIGLQVKEDGQGEYKILEINPRIQGTSVAALGIGINLPALAVEQEFGPVEIDESSISWGTSFVRYYEEAFYK